MKYKGHDVSLEQGSDGNINLVIGEWFILGVTKKGKLLRYSCVGDDIGLKLNKNEEIKLDKGMY